ncbi:MAG: hypothetical protein ACC650_09350 [Gammaproteobacteria bacterium]
MEYILGKNDTDIQVDTAEECKRAIISMLQQAQHNIDIFTQDLEPAIYNNNSVEQAILHLAKRQKNTRVRILVQDSKKSIQHGHCLIRLAQQLTSSVFIHTPSLTHKNEQSAFLVVDRMGLVYRALATDRNYEANINFRSPRMATRQMDLFDDIWEHSTPDMQTRRVHI